MGFTAICAFRDITRSMLRQILVLLQLSLLFSVSIADDDSMTDFESLQAAQQACQSLNATYPALVAFPGSTQYDSDIAHWALSSQQNATCSIEPQTPEQVGAILQLLGTIGTRAPFAVKSGGHAYNRHFSSTRGVQISMAQFSSLTYDADANTATIGSGLTWDEVYSQLDEYNVTVVGGRVGGVGIGLTLGGGYSWKSQQYGLSVDTILSFALVLPSGDAITVTNSSYHGLFWGLKGGLNNFGIVTSITFQTFPQTLVYGGTITYGSNVTDQVNSAVADFSTYNTDPKAGIIITYGYELGTTFSFVNIFYDAPTAPSGTFDAFFDIANLGNTVTTQSYADFIGTGAGPGFEPFAIAQNDIPIIVYTVPILEEMVDQVLNIGTALSAQFPSTLFGVSASGEPFYGAYNHSKGGAYPHHASRPVNPSAMVTVFQTSTAPDPVGMYPVFVNATKELSHRVQAQAVQQNQSRFDDIRYPNYCLAGTPLVLMYGAHVPALAALAEYWDPNGVMKQTGGFKF